jgi:hypothetical protein
MTMSSPLRPCPECARHVRAIESACPFCEAKIDSPTDTAPPSLAASRRLSRAALFAVGASAAVLSCKGDCSNPAVVAVYGAPPMSFFDAAVPPQPEDAGGGAPGETSVPTSNGGPHPTDAGSHSRP